MRWFARRKTFRSEADGFAVVEAAVVFPIMFMVLFALIMLAVYLPQQAMLQRVTAMAATTLATQSGDTWLYFDEGAMSYKRYANYDELRQAKGWVYDWGFPSGSETKTMNLIKKIDEKENLPLITNGELTLSCKLNNYVVFKELEVTATRVIKIPVDFSAIMFPKTLTLTVTAKAVVKDGDEFVRNIDLGISFLDWLGGQLGSITDAFGNSSVIDMLF